MRDAAGTPDGATSPLGEACTRDQSCAAGLACLTGLHAFGGYCAGSGCAACDGACVGTPRGELCMRACAIDADCRASEGYVCDPAWKACVMPNATSIVPRTCPAPRGIGRDPQFAPTVAAADANESAAVVMPDGGLLVVHANAAALAATRIDVHGRVAPSTPIADLAGPAAHPSLARDPSGQLYASWSAATGVMLARSKDGTTWSEPVAIDACTSCRATVVAGGGGVHVVFAHEGIRVRTSRDGGKTFGAASTVLAAGSANAVAGADGRLHVVGLDGGPLGAFGSANQRIQYAANGRAITVSRRDEVLPFYFAIPSIAVDTRRRWLYIAYVRGGRDGVWDIALSASKDGGQTWVRRRIGDDPPACAIHMVPHLALDATTGTLHVAWYDARGERPRFAHATCMPGLARCVQVGRINDVPFGTALSTVRHHATWIGDAGTLVVDDKRRVLHAVWTQPVDDGGKLVARVFTARSKLR